LETSTKDVIIHTFHHQVQAMYSNSINSCKKTFEKNDPYNVHKSMFLGFLWWGKGANWQ